MGKLTFWKWAGITAGLVSALLFMAQVTGAATLIPVPQGGTGASSFPQGGWIYGNGVNPLGASSSPTVGILTATSTTATSSFANGINLSAGCFAFNGTCLSNTNLLPLNNTWTGLNTFTATSTQATTTLVVRDKGGQVFNVLAYGAKFDGVTDDLTAIQTAIDAARAVGGGIVDMPRGTSTISNVLTVYNNRH